MAADFAITYGSFAYSSLSGLTVEGADEPLGVRLRQSATPGRDGAYSATSLLEPKRFTLKGILTASTATALRTAWRTFRAAHSASAPAKFYQHSDQYVWAQVAGIGKADIGGMAGAWIRWEVEFFASDPLVYAETATATSSLASGGTMTNSGDVATRPTFTLVVGTAGTITIENSTTGESMVLTVTTTGTYTIDCRAETVVKVSTSMPEVFTGQFLRLSPGANTIAVSTAGGAVVTTLSASHRSAWV